MKACAKARSLRAEQKHQSFRLQVGRLLVVEERLALAMQQTPAMFVFEPRVRQW